MPIQETWLIRQARERGFYQHDVARLVGLDEREMSRVAHGRRRLHGERLQRLADVLDVPLTVLTAELERAT